MNCDEINIGKKNEMNEMIKKQCEGDRTSTTQSKQATCIISGSFDFNDNKRMWKNVNTILFSVYVSFILYNM